MSPGSVWSRIPGIPGEPVPGALVGPRSGGIRRHLRDKTHLGGLLGHLAEGRLAGYILFFRGFRSVFGQSWAQERAQRPRLDKCYINQRKLAREIDSEDPGA